MNLISKLMRSGISCAAGISETTKSVSGKDAIEDGFHTIVLDGVQVPFYKNGNKIIVKSSAYVEFTDCKCGKDCERKVKKDIYATGIATFNSDDEAAGVKYNIEFAVKLAQTRSLRNLIQEKKAFFNSLLKDDKRIYNCFLETVRSKFPETKMRPFGDLKLLERQYDNTKMQ